MAAGATYEPIATTTLGSAQSSITFSSIPSTYTDLVLICSVKGDASIGLVRVRLNGDTGSNYSFTRIYGTGSVAASDRYTNTTSMELSDPGTGFNSQFILGIGHIQNYSNTTTYKTMLGRGNELANVVQATVNLWRNTAAVNSVTVLTTSNNFIAGSTATLYGITAA